MVVVRVVSSLLRYQCWKIFPGLKGCLSINCVPSFSASLCPPSKRKNRAAYEIKSPGARPLESALAANRVLTFSRPPDSYGSSSAGPSRSWCLASWEPRLKGFNPRYSSNAAQMRSSGLAIFECHPMVNFYFFLRQDVQCCGCDVFLRRAAFRDIATWQSLCLMV